jgi:hypothetical protein
MEITMNTALLVFDVIIGLVALCTFCSILIKPIREKVFNTNRSKEGERCLLRSEMLRIYYTYLEKQEIRQFEFENFIKLYDAYKALGGNSFIDEINLEVRQWKIVR